MANNKPLVRFLDNDKMKLAENTKRIVDGLLVEIKHGFEWDGASIPRWAWSIAGHPKDDDVIVPSLFHDGLYSSKLVSRWKADRIFYKLLRREGVGRFKANYMFWAVRVGGSKGYKKGKFANLVKVTDTRKVLNVDARVRK